MYSRIKVLIGIILICSCFISGNAEAEDTKDGLIKKYEPGLQVYYEWNYKKGKREGLSRSYDTQGKPCWEANYKNDKLEGLEKKYYVGDCGILMEETNYVNDKREGLSKSYHSNGNLWSEGNYKDNKAEGVFKSYYDNGLLEEERPYKNGFLEGLSRSFDKNGKLTFEKYYEQGKLLRLVEYDPQGAVISDKKLGELTAKVMFENIKSFVPTIEAVSVQADSESRFQGHYRDYDFGLAGGEIYIFPDKTYYYLHWADILPLTIYDKGTWEYKDGFLEFTSDKTVKNDDILPVTKYIPFLFEFKKKRVLHLMETTNTYGYFCERIKEKKTLTEYQQSLDLSSFKQVETLNQNNFEAVQKAVFEKAWHPEFFEKSENE